MFGPTQASPIQSIFVALMLLILGLALIPLLKSPNKKYLAGLFFSAFVVRIIFVYVVYYYLVGVGGDGFAFLDDRRYNDAGTVIAAALREGKDGYDLFSWQQNPGYFYLNGWLYSLLGTDTFSARVLNAFLSSITVVLVFEITRLLFELRVAKTAGLLFAFMPNIVYMSTLQFKETALIFVMVYTVYLLVAKNEQKITLRSIMALIGTLVVMWYLRKDFTLPYIGIVMLWLALRYTGLDGWIARMQKKGLAVFAGLALLVIGGGVLTALSNTQAGHVFFERFENIAGHNREFTEKASTGQVGFSRHLRINSTSDIYKLPIAVGFSTIAPLPAWGWITSGEHAGIALYSISNLFFILLLPFVILGFSLSKGTGAANSIMLRWFPLLTLIGISILYISVSRYKEQLMPFFFIWAAVALCQRSKYKNYLSMFYFSGVFIVALAVVVALMFR